MCRPVPRAARRQAAFHPAVPRVLESRRGKRGGTPQTCTDGGRGTSPPPKPSESTSAPVQKYSWFGGLRQEYPPSAAHRCRNAASIGRLGCLCGIFRPCGEGSAASRWIADRE